jgi:hypothetical protein
LIPKVFKDIVTPLTTTCKKVRVDGKSNKKHNESSKDDSFTLVLAFFQFEESSSKIETMKIKMHSQMAKEAKEVQNSITKTPWRWKNIKLRIFYKLNFR